MTFAFLNKTDGSIIHVDADETPLNAFQNNPEYQKLYEEARIEVIYSSYPTDHLNILVHNIYLKVNTYLF